MMQDFEKVGKSGFQITQDFRKVGPGRGGFLRTQNFGKVGSGKGEFLMT